MYVLTNGIYYCTKSDTKKIRKDQELSMAFRYTKESDASRDLIIAPNRLKGFYLLDEAEAKSSLKIIAKAIKTVIPNNKVCKRTRINVTIRKSIYRESEGYCQLCGKFVDYEDFTIDHIVPLAKGGTNNIKNLHNVPARFVIRLKQMFCQMNLQIRLQK